MTHNWINQQNNHSLILFFNGWGMNQHIVKHLDYEKFDVLEFDSYHKESVFDFSSLHSYQKVYIIGWSMGVWEAARRDFSGLNIVRKIAICGTTEPISDQYGIPKAIFYATADNISAESLEKFSRRAMGSKPEFEKLLALPARNVDDIQVEIQWWVEDYHPSDANFWDTAVVGSKDAIIPPANQLAAWQKTSTQITTIHTPHYPFAAFSTWRQIIEIE